MWATAEPVVRSWIERRLGPIGKLEEAVDGAAAVGKLALMFPDVVNEIMQAGGLRLDQETLASFARTQRRALRVQKYALVTGALALVVIAIKTLL
jgi:ubiquinone biosynthesis protein